MTILTKDSFDEFISGDRVLVTFSAAWCGPCRMMAPLLEKAETTNQGRVAKVDVDDSSEIAAKFGIRSIPTTVIFSKGEAVEKKVGLLKENDIIALLN